MYVYPEDGEVIELDPSDRREWSVGRIGHHNDISFCSRRVSRLQALVRATELRAGEYVWEIKHVGENPTWRTSYLNGELRSIQLPHNQWERLIEDCLYQIDQYSLTFTSYKDDTLTGIDGDEDKTVASTEPIPDALQKAIAASNPDKVEGWADAVSAIAGIVAELLRSLWAGPLQNPSPLFRVVWSAFIVLVAGVGLPLLMLALRQ